MKPNLFRSTSNSLAEQFPLLPRIRRSFIGLLLFCLLFLVIGIADNNTISVSVKPLENSSYFNQPVTTYEAGHITLNGQFIISHPTVIEKILLPDTDTGLDILTLLFLSVISLIIILFIPKLHQQNLFRKDISNGIRLLGYLIMFHGIFSIYRTIQYVPEKIKLLTHNEFTSIHNFPILIMAELYFSLIVIALGGMYQRGIKLQQEQDLTI